MKTFDEFQAFVNATAREHDKGEPDRVPLYATLGLAGETGEVVELVKKAYRDGKPADGVAVLMECGDVAWYLARIMARFGLTLEDAINAAEIKLSRRRKFGKDPGDERIEVEDYLMKKYTP